MHLQHLLASTLLLFPLGSVYLGDGSVNASPLSHQEYASPIQHKDLHRTTAKGGGIGEAWRSEERGSSEHVDWLDFLGPPIIPFTSSQAQPITPVSGHSRKIQGEGDEATGTILQVLRADDRFHAFVKLVERCPETADLLNNPTAQVTLFAPSNEALERLDRYPDIPDKALHAILQYHILPVAMLTEDLIQHRTVNTTLGAEDSSDKIEEETSTRIRIVPLTHHRIYVNYAYIVDENVHADNGVIHSLNHLLIPPPRAVDLLYMLPDRYSILTSALAATGLTEFVQNNSPITLFAPTNQAFSRLGRRTLAFLFSPHGRDLLRKVLLYHISPSQHYTESLLIGHQGHHVLQTMLEGASLEVDLYEKSIGPHHNWLHFNVKGEAKGNYAHVRFADLPSQNAAIHVVDHVLLPSCDQEEELQIMMSTDDGTDVPFIDQEEEDLQEETMGTPKEVVQMIEEWTSASTGHVEDMVRRLTEGLFSTYALA